jgi:glyoxylate reductase
MKPLILNGAPLDKPLRARIEAASQCEVLDISPTDSPDVLTATQQSRVVGWICTARTPVSAGAIALLPALRVISTRAVGYDNIDVDAAVARGIVIGYTPGVLDRAVADLAFAMILCLSRSLIENDRFVRSGAWQQGMAPLSRDLRGKHLGLLGLGRIGGELAKLAHGFGMSVAYFQRQRDWAMEAAGVVTYCTRESLFRNADFLSVHLPLSATTLASVGAAEFEWMKPSAWFINTSRGAVVNEVELIDALQTRRIAGAGLDVMATEPLDPASPLCHLPNVLLQPHAGSATVETRAAMMALAVDNLLLGLAGKKMLAALEPLKSP